MTGAEKYSIAAALILLFVVVLQRRVIFSWSAIGIFFTTNLIFTYVGVLILPWVRAQLPMWFPGPHMELVKDVEWQLSITLAVGGGLIALASYHFAYVIFSGGSLLIKAPNLLAARVSDEEQRRPIRIGFDPLRLIVLSGMGFFVSAAYVLLHISVFITGFTQGILAASPDAVFNARAAATDSYLYVLLVFNVIPFFATALLLLWRIRRGPYLGIYTILYCGYAAFLLLSVFQKRPLIVFLIGLFLAYTWVQRLSKRPRLRIRLRRPKKGYIRAALYGGVLFMILIALYYAQTGIGRTKQLAPLDTFKLLAQIAITRIFGRLALPAPMYAHFFPQIAPHYGFRNLGLLHRIFGFEVYQDTPAVLQYFSQRTEGSAAVSAIIDFYGAFGIPGWIIGTALLGVFLNRLDAILKRLHSNASNALLIIFMFVFIYYLSQASVARSLLGYGGAIFVALWFLLTVRRSRPAVAQQSNRPPVGLGDRPASI